MGKRQGKKKTSRFFVVQKKVPIREMLNGEEKRREKDWLGDNGVKVNDMVARWKRWKTRSRGGKRGKGEARA